MAGFAALLIACLGLCALNYSSHYALNAYGLSCATFIVFMLFGMIPDSWQQSINQQQSSSLQHQLNYANYTSTLTGKGLLTRGNGHGSGGLIIELIYFALLFILSVLLLFAFILAQYFRRRELEESEQQEQEQQQHMQVHAHTRHTYCDINNCTCDLGTLVDGNLSAIPFINTSGDRQRHLESGQLDLRPAQGHFIKNYHEPRSSLNGNLIRRRQPIATLMRDTNNQWMDESGGVNAPYSANTNNRDNISIINSLRGNLSSRSLVSLTNDVINNSRTAFAGDGQDNDRDDVSLDTPSRYQQQQSLENSNNQLPPLIHRGFYYTTMKDNYGQQQHPNGSTEMLDPSRVDQSVQTANHHRDIYNSSDITINDEMAGRDTITSRHRRQQHVAAHHVAKIQHPNNTRLLSAATSSDARCRCDLNVGSRVVPPHPAAKLHSDNNFLAGYYDNKSRYYNTMPSKLNLSSVYVIRPATSGQRLAKSKQKSPKPSGGSSVMAMTAAAAAALLGGVTGSSLVDDGGAIGAGSGGSIFDGNIDEGMPTDVMGDSGLEMTSSLGQHTGYDVDFFDQHVVDERSGLDAGHHQDVLAPEAHNNQSFRRYLNNGSNGDFGP